MKDAGRDQICSTCELQLPADLPEILCPRCALREFETSSTQSNFPKPFGSYELLEEIGRGGMGVVYRARQIALERVVALKVVLNGQYAAPEMLRRFRVEARATGKLRHRNLICVHEVGTHEGQSFLVMDYVDGVPLSRLLQNGPLSSRRAADYGISIARAVSHAHKHGVMHRDLKPSNVLIDAEDEVRVSDFGLARTMDEDSDLTVSGQVLGSPNYLSPEQACANRDHITAQSDIYSIGAIIYHLLTGRPPFVAPTILETLRSVVHDQPDTIRSQNAAVPVDLETICLKCLSKEPNDRYPSATELADDLERFLRFEPIRARPQAWTERAIYWSRRNPAAASLILVLVMGAMALSGALYEAHQEEKRKSHAIKIVSDRLGASIEQLWERDDKLIELVTSEELAALAGNYKERATNATRLRLSIKPPETPLDLQKLYQPLLEHLEASLSKTLGHSVRIDLAMSNRDSLGRLKAATNEITFSRIGAVKYLAALDEQAPITDLVQEKSLKEAQIFARRESSIRKLSDLHGKSIVFAGKRAAISEWAKVFLVRETGITGRDLRGWEQREVPSGAPLKSHSHKPSIDAVLAGEYDAGVARSKYVAQNPELIPIYTFQSTPNVWVISSSAPSALRSALAAALLKIRDPKLLESAPTEIEGFAPVDVQMLRNLESVLQNEVRLFEQP